MPESEYHHMLVERGFEYILSLSSAAPEKAYCDDNSSGEPLYIQGLTVRPDIFVRFSDIAYLGEAKTDHDILSQHSKYQYDEYLLNCEMSEENTRLIIFTSWRVSAAINDYLRIRTKRLRLAEKYFTVVSDRELLMSK